MEKGTNVKVEYAEKIKKIKETIQALITEFNMCYDEIDDLNHDYSFEYIDD